MNNSEKINNTPEWLRRSIVDNERVKEQVELYESIGFEVMVKDVVPDQLPAEYCKECYISDPDKYKIIYTRKKAIE